MNVLAPYVISGRLIDLVAKTPGGGRIVNVASLSASYSIDFGNLQVCERYIPAKRRSLFFVFWCLVLRLKFRYHSGKAKDLCSFFLCVCSCDELIWTNLLCDYSEPSCLLLLTGGARVCSLASSWYCCCSIASRTMNQLSRARSAWGFGHMCSEDTIGFDGCSGTEWSEGEDSFSTNRLTY